MRNASRRPASVGIIPARVPPAPAVGDLFPAPRFVATRCSDPRPCRRAGAQTHPLFNGAASGGAPGRTRGAGLRAVSRRDDPVPSDGSCLRGRRVPRRVSSRAEGPREGLLRRGLSVEWIPWNPFHIPAVTRPSHRAGPGRRRTQGLGNIGESQISAVLNTIGTLIAYSYFRLSDSPRTWREDIGFNGGFVARVAWAPGRRLRRAR